jgi:hypothetical protein
LAASESALSDEEHDRLGPLLPLRLVMAAAARVWAEGGCADAVAVSSVCEPELACTTSEGAFVAHV